MIENQKEQDFSLKGYTKSVFCGTWGRVEEAGDK